MPGTIVDVHLGPDELRSALRSEAAAGLRSTPKVLSPKWLYDERGCDLFEQITRLPEYYPFRRELAILTERAGEIAELAQPRTLVELGSGTSEKTRLLLDACARLGTLERFVPLDVSEPTLRAAADALLVTHPGLQVHAVVGDFERHLDRIPSGDRRLVVFLGGTIGNLQPPARARFLADLAAGFGPHDLLLLGTDLVKDHDRLVRAYDDAAGVTAAFNRNVVTVLGRELGAAFDEDDFDHVARYDPLSARIEMWLRARRDLVVEIAALETEVRFAAGEEMLTETSAKFTQEQVASELAAAGFTLDRWWTDPEGDFALSLCGRDSDIPRVSCCEANDLRPS